MAILPVSLCLLTPAAELHISPNHDPQCGIDDVIRRTLDEVAYFSTATAIGSCSLYSRFTISGGLLMIDMISPS